MSASFNSLLRPSSVAIIGASNDPTRIGGRPLRYLINAGFTGEIYPINPKYDTVQGLQAYPSINDVPVTVEFALIAVPAAVAVKAVEDCAAQGVKAVVVFSSGFAEIGADGIAMQQRLSEIAQQTGMRIVGPNCLGVFNPSANFFITFTATLEQGFPEPGRLSIISQSGAYGSHVYMLARKRNLKINYWITTGNECDVHVAECLHWLADDPSTDVIAVYAEGIRDGTILLDAFARARANHKPVIFMKVGRTEVGAQAAASHTASLAGSDVIFSAVCRQYGVHRAATTEELLDVAYACGRGIYPNGKRLGLVTISGGVGVQMADTASEFGFDVAPMPTAAQDKLKALLPFAAPRNPVDITAQAFNNPSLIGQNMELMLKEGNYDAIVAFFTSVAGSPYLAPILSETFNDVCSRFPNRLLVLSIIASEDICRAYEEQGYLIFEDPSRAIAAIKALCNFADSFALPPIAVNSSYPQPNQQPLPEQPDEYSAKQLLAEHGISVLPEKLVSNADEAAQAAQQIGLPVATKIVSPDILHKTEMGGVILNLNSTDAVRQATQDILQRAREHYPTAKLSGILIAPQIGTGVDVIAGIQYDPVFGPVIMFGLGGVFVEVLQDVTFRVAPFDINEAHRMMQEIKGYPLLQGVRGQAPSDIAALAETLVKLSEFAVHYSDDLESVDINPLRVLAKSQGVVALDVVIVTKTTHAVNDG